MLATVKILVLAILACGLAAIEAPAEVIPVTDGDTIVVTLSGAEERVRLLYLDTPESRNNSHGAATPAGKLASEFMDLQAKAGSVVTPWAPAADLERDRYKRLLAMVITSRGDTLQERIPGCRWAVG